MAQIRPFGFSQALSGDQVNLQINVLHVSFCDALFHESLGNGKHSIVPRMVAFVLGRLTQLSAMLVSYDPRDWWHMKDLASAEMGKAKFDRLVENKLFKLGQPVALAQNGLAILVWVIRLLRLWQIFRLLTTILLVTLKRWRALSWLLISLGFHDSCDFIIKMITQIVWIRGIL